MELEINKIIYPLYIAKTKYQKIKGLIGKTNLNYGLLIPNCNSIHTYFMKENIDILGLNNKNVVIYKYENLSPNKIITIYNDINNTNILELPFNSTKKVRIGDILTFKNKNII